MTAIEGLKTAFALFCLWGLVCVVVLAAISAIEAVLRWRKSRRNARAEFDLDERYAPRCLNCMIEKGKSK